MQSGTTKKRASATHTNGDSNFRVKLAKKLSKEAYNDYVSRGVAPERAAILAETVEWAFSRERSDIF